MEDWMVEQIAALWRLGDGAALLFLVGFSGLVMGFGLWRIQRRRNSSTVYRWGLTTILVAVLGVMFSFIADRHATLTANDIARLGLTLIAGVGTSLVATSATTDPSPPKRDQWWRRWIRQCRSGHPSSHAHKTRADNHCGEPQQGEHGQEEQDASEKSAEIFEAAHRVASRVLAGRCIPPPAPVLAPARVGGIGVYRMNVSAPLPSASIGSLTLQSPRSK